MPHLQAGSPQNPVGQRQNWRKAEIWLVDTGTAGGSWQRGKGQNKSIHWHQRSKKGEYQGWANCSAGGRSLKRILRSWPGSNGDLELTLGNFRKHVVCHIYYIINKWLETFSTTIGGNSVGQCTKTEDFALRVSFWGSTSPVSFHWTRSIPFSGKAIHIDIGCANKDLNVSSQEFTPNMQISYYLLQTLPWNPHQCTKFGVTSHLSPGQSQKQSQLPLLPATNSAYFNQIPAVLLGESVLLPSIWLWHSYFSKLIWLDPNTKDRGFQHLQR